MPYPIKRVFLPYGVLKPDAGEFNNDGMSRALNVVPAGDTYLPSRLWRPRSGQVSPTIPRGFHVHPVMGAIGVSDSNWIGYIGSLLKLYEMGGWSVADKTRTVGGDYDASNVRTEFGWQFASFGESIIAVNGYDEPQILLSPSSANFTKLIQSTFDFKSRFVWPVQNNLFHGNLFLDAPYDGLSAGVNDTVVAWSQDGVPRQYGSFNADPQLLGAGYQPLAYDLGPIVGGIGGQYLLVALERGWARCDGPPYTFNPISQGIGCKFPNSIVRFDDDVYFLGPAGPMVFRGGNGLAEQLGKGRIARTLMDQIFGGTYAYQYGPDPIYFCGAASHTERQVWWAFTSNGANFTDEVFKYANLILVYDVDSQAFSFIDPRDESDTSAGAQIGLTFLRSRPEQLAEWTPGRDLVALMLDAGGGSGPQYRGATPVSGSDSIPVETLLEKAYVQLDDDRTTRIRRIRPIFSQTSNDPLPTISITLRTKNKPYETPVTTGPRTTRDKHGWITFPRSKFGDFHQMELTQTFLGARVRELEGVDVEFEIGPAYSA